MARVFTITEGLENMGALKTGGQGSVYKARRTGEILSAVKILPTPIYTESVEDKNYRDFQNEVHKLKRVNETLNPNVVRILSSGITESGSFPFIEMEFIEGPDLEELLKPPHDPVFSIKEILKVADHLSCALAHCHKVDVKHGDIKSNNVKFNLHTGNYVLLDFGLAIMSDEQRRTSLRHAGAIEFMAPEQSEGIMLFETDVYSFGVVLYELIAGVVPFPLRDSGGLSRNQVMLAHMETTPPDVLELRSNNMPAGWSEERKAHELNVPQWLLNMMYKCLQKAPAARFRNGVELHEYVVLNSTRITADNEKVSERLHLLEKENQRLRQEKEELQRSLNYYQQAANNYQQQLKNTHPSNPLAYERNSDTRPQYYQTPEPKKGFPAYLLFFIVLALGATALLATYFLKDDESPRKVQTTPEQPKRKAIIGQYVVKADRAYFHNEPDESTRRNAYLLPNSGTISVSEERNGFVYTEFTNSRGQTSKGWLRLQDLLTLDEWNEKRRYQPPKLTDEEIRLQLAEARGFLNNNQYEQALNIYTALKDQEVPEALYEYGNLALQNRNNEIGCGKAYEMVKKASDQGYTPAKRTLGFLYLFGENRSVLAAADYSRCHYKKDVARGSKLLMEAVLEGDSTANRWLQEFRAQEQAPDTSH